MNECSCWISDECPKHVGRVRFWVVCPDFVSGPHRTYDIAENTAIKINSDSREPSCPYRHEVVESATKPVAANSSWPEDNEGE